MSQTEASTRPLASSPAVSSNGSRRRPQMTTRAPRPASSSAVTRPMPDPAPDTIATVPSSRPGRKTSDAMAASVSDQAGLLLLLARAGDVGARGRPPPAVAQPRHDPHSDPRRRPPAQRDAQREALAAHRPRLRAPDA